MEIEVGINDERALLNPTNFPCGFLLGLVHVVVYPDSSPKEVLPFIILF